jgi:hypothetical protein
MAAAGVDEAIEEFRLGRMMGQEDIKKGEKGFEGQGISQPQTCEIQKERAPPRNPLPLRKCSLLTWRSQTGRL